MDSVYSNFDRFGQLINGATVVIQTDGQCESDYYTYFDCPTDEILITTSAPESPVKSEDRGLSPGEGERDSTIYTVMSTGRLANSQQVSNLANSANNGGGGSNSVNADSPDPSDTDSVTVTSGTGNSRIRDLILIPTNGDSLNLQHAIQQFQANGVTVVDVRSLQSSGGGADSSGHSSPGNEPATVAVQDSEGSHFITVSGDGTGVGYHVQYVEPQEMYTQQPQQGQNQMDSLRSYPVYVSEAGGVISGGTTYTVSGSAGGSNAAWSAGSSYPQHHYLVAGAALDEMVAAHHHRTVASPEGLATEVQYMTEEVCDGTGEAGGGGANAAAGGPRTPPATVSHAAVQWLLENYETAESVSLPRSTLYSHYLHHCDQRDLEPVNAASFGKLIRSVFVGLRTRRLGTRGNSKYHYYGIRVKPGSSLASGYSSSDDGKHQSAGVRCVGARSHGRPHDEDVTGGGGHGMQSGGQVMHQHHQYLGDGSNAIPDFPDIVFAGPLPGDCTLEDVDTLRSIYREHCEAFLDAVLSLELSTVEQLWREFWRHASDNNNAADDCEEEKYLSKSKLFQLCTMTEVQEWVRNVDILFYQRLVEVLLPDVLRPIPSALTQAIRNFAKGVEQWLSVAMCGAPVGMVRAKAAPASALAASLRRYTSLNHLAQAARAVLHNQQQIQQMLADLNRVDFRSVQEQAAWACGCESSESASALQADFKATLARGASLEQWAAWLEAAVRRALRPHERHARYATHARHFLLKWSFYSSMVIRDLTLRSAASFGSFHLIRLLYDEYMFYLVEQRVAAHEGRPPISVMTEFNLTNEGNSKPESDIGDISTSDYDDMDPVKADNSPNKRMKIS